MEDSCGVSDRSGASTLATGAGLCRRGGGGGGGGGGEEGGGGEDGGGGGGGGGLALLDRGEVHIVPIVRPASQALSSACRGTQLATCY